MVLTGSMYGSPKRNKKNTLGSTDAILNRSQRILNAQK
jgi:hypothetical protein